MGDGEPDGAAVRGGRRLARVAAFPVRYGRVAAVAARTCAVGGRDLRDGDVRRRELRLRRSRARRSPPSSSPTRPTSGRRATACSTARSRSSSGPASARVEALKRARTRALRRARAIVVPSAYLAAIAAAGVSSGRGSRCSRTRPRRSTSTPSPSAPGTFVFVGRLTRQKALDVAIDAVARCPGGTAHRRRRRPRPRRGSRHVARELRRAERIDFRGSLPRAEALALVAGSEAAPADERLGELPALGGRGARGRRAGSLDGRGRRA